MAQDICESRFRLSVSNPLEDINCYATFGSCHAHYRGSGRGAGVQFLGHPRDFGSRANRAAGVYTAAHQYATPVTDRVSDPAADEYAASNGDQYGYAHADVDVHADRYKYADQYPVSDLHSVANRDDCWAE